MISAEREKAFGFTPKWLEAYVKENEGAMGKLEDLEKKREEEGMGDMPWLVYLESIALGRGISVESVVSFMAKFHGFQVVPLHINLIDAKDYSDYFPIEITEKYWVIPTSLSETFLNVALLEPEIARDVYDRYYAWLGTRRLKAVQFFLTLPASYEQFATFVKRLQEKRFMKAEAV